jgi:hypothetical protein
VSLEQKRATAEQKVRTAEQSLRMAQQQANQAAQRFQASPTRANEHKAWAMRQAVAQAERERTVALRTLRALTQEVTA